LQDHPGLTSFLVTDDSHEARAHEEMTNRPHEAKWSHELIGGAAAYEAMKAYEEHEAREGMYSNMGLKQDS
jgi:hypothetical protein